MKKAILDTSAMCMRSIRISFRNPEAFATAIIVPALLMWLFGVVFRSTMNFGEYSVINFIVPGIILQTLGQAAVTTGVTINNDMTKGIIDRFRSMPITNAAVLVGHVFSSVIRNIITIVIIIGVAMLLGFRPQAGLASWVLIVIILFLVMLALSWIAVIGGLTASDAGSVQGKLFLLFVLPFLSTGFVPVSAIDSGWLKWFVANQPMTPIIDGLRGLMLGIPVDGSTITLAFSWSIGITIVAFVIATQLYKRKIS
jgi:ABC-2 type transport system permease protein